ncbi:hypothetical protein TRVL_06523 [Trypanosoma vivax]|nr:hypothetical protein TRVL_06523 [Trypanosoma vivax]
MHASLPRRGTSAALYTHPHRIPLCLPASPLSNAHTRSQNSLLVSVDHRHIHANAIINSTGSGNDPTTCSSTDTTRQGTQAGGTPCLSNKSCSRHSGNAHVAALLQAPY